MNRVWAQRSFLCGRQTRRLFSSPGIPIRGEKKSIVPPPPPPPKDVKESEETFEEAEILDKSTIFDPPSSLLTTTRLERARTQGAIIEDKVPHKLRSSATWFTFDPNLSYGIRNSVNPNFRLTFEHPETGKLVRYRYESIINNKGLVFEAGVRVGTTCVSVPMFQKPIIYSQLPKDLTITSGLCASLAFVQLEYFQVAEFPDYNFYVCSAGFSFGLGFGIIKDGKIQFNHRHTPLESLREKTNLNWFTSVMSPVIKVFWFGCYIFVASSPVITLLFDA